MAKSKGKGKGKKSKAPEKNEAPKKTEASAKKVESAEQTTGPDKEAGQKHLHAIATSVLCGCMWFLACADFDIWPLAYIAMVPGMWVVEHAPTRRKALFYGWLAGVVANAGGFYWITGLLERFGHLPMPVAVLGLLLLAAYQATVFWLFFMLLRSLRNKSKEILGQPLPMVLLAPPIMVSFEYLVPFIFPWYLAITQAWVTPVIQIADISGPLGVSAFLILINSAVYDAIVETGPRRKRSLIAGAVGAALVLGYGFLRISQVQSTRADAPVLRVGVVQGNIPFDEKGIKRQELAPKQLRALQEKSAELEAQGAQFLMWTESSYPYFVPRDFQTDFPEEHPWRIRRGFEAPLMLGALTRNRKNLEERPYNSALLLDSDSTFTARFDKIFLLVFGEYIPFLETFPSLEKMLPKNTSHFSRGKEIVTFPFELDGKSYRLGPMICYEDILPEFNRELGSSHPHLLVNITNDSWFGDTSEPWEHMALSVYRAVEMRTDLVRAVNTGVSAFIDATGKVYNETYAVDPKITPKPVDGIVDDVRLVEGGHSFFMRFGNVFAWLCILFVLGVWQGWPRLRGRRKEQAS